MPQPKYTQKKNFVSDIDQFLTDFDKTHAPTDAQIAEINKHRNLRNDDQD